MKPYNESPEKVASVIADLENWKSGMKLPQWSNLDYVNLKDEEMYSYRDNEEIVLESFRSDERLYGIEYIAPSLRNDKTFLAKFLIEGEIASAKEAKEDGFTEENRRIGVLSGVTTC